MVNFRKTGIYEIKSPLFFAKCSTGKEFFLSTWNAWEILYLLNHERLQIPNGKSANMNAKELKNNHKDFETKT